MKTYFEKLKDPRWQQMRLKIMERDKFRCTNCLNNAHTLNVHHVYYGKRKDPWDYDPKFLITLCQECHQDFEQQREEVLKAMNWGVPLITFYRLATTFDPHFGDIMGLADVSHAICKTLPYENQTQYRIESCRKLIAMLESKITDLEADLLNERGEE